MVSFGKNGAANIDAQTGEVLTLANFEKLGKKISQPAKAISNDMALNKAKKLIAENNLVDVSGLDVEHVAPVDNFGDDPCGLVRVVWKRSYKGFSFKNDKVMIDFDPETMEVVGYSNGLLSEEPSSVAVSVNETKALALASEMIENKDIKTVAGLSANLEITNPNYYWTDAYTGEEPSTTRLSWLVPIFNPQTGQQLGEIWIDAEDGSILGGVECR